MRGDWATEVPTTLSPDGRNRAPHLKSFRDGWRSLRFYLVMAPRWMFGMPGLVFFALGCAFTLRLLFGPISVGAVQLDFHTMLYTSACMIIGYQMILMGIFAKLLAVDTGLHPPLTKLTFFKRRSTLILFCLSGVFLVFVGFLLLLFAVYEWRLTGFGDIPTGGMLRLVIGSLNCLLLGSVTLCAGFLFGLFNLISEHQGEVMFESAGKS